MDKVRIIIVGAGGRGTVYANCAKENKDKAVVVGVAEPRDFFRERLVKEHGIPAGNVFKSWEEAAKREKFADVAVIGTQDKMHVEPMRAFANKGYHILLEKPMAPDAVGCREISRIAKKNGIIFAVCHVMRYTDYTRKMKEIIDSGAIGEIVSMQHLEPVGYWHFAHSYVRGNWRNESESSSMLLAKSCHDLDWIRHIMDCRCESVSSFGSLKHFVRKNQPKGASDRCLDCKVEADCPYSAVRFYQDRIKTNSLGWPVDVITSDLTVEGVNKALRDGPYGRCVYACDNDVVDNQVVNMSFEGNRTVSFSMIGCSIFGGRRTTVFGTRGELYGDSDKIKLFDFLTEKHADIETKSPEAGFLGGHGGGDPKLFAGFIDAVAAGDSSRILTGPDVSLEAHLMVFAAEKARREKRVVDMKEMYRD